MEEGEPMIQPKRSSKERRMRLEKVGSYRIGRTLGRGNFAVVKLAYHELANSKVAMKVVDKQNLDPENLAKIDREIQILQKLNHPYIIKLYEVGFWVDTKSCKRLGDTNRKVFVHNNRLYRRWRAFW